MSHKGIHIFLKLEKISKKSGGIVIIYKSCLEDFLFFPKTDCEYVQWCKFKKGVLMDDKEILLGCVYIPPENSVYSSPEAFNDIEEEFLKLSRPNTLGAFLGDFNAKCGKLQDYVEPDESLLDILNLYDEIDLIDFLYDFENLTRQGIPPLRVSQDENKPNSFGVKLIEFCNKHNFYIGNSRLPGDDQNIGKKT